MHSEQKHRVFILTASTVVSCSSPAISTPLCLNSTLTIRLRKDTLTIWRRQPAQEVRWHAL